MTARSKMVAMLDRLEALEGEGGTAPVDLEPRVAALEAATADLETRVAALEALNPPASRAKK